MTNGTDYLEYLKMTESSLEYRDYMAMLERGDHLDVNKMPIESDEVTPVDEYGCEIR